MYHAAEKSRFPEEYDPKFIGPLFAQAFASIRKKNSTLLLDWGKMERNLDLLRALESLQLFRH